MSDTRQYPIGIAQNALQAQLQAISLLEARVAGLVAQTSWPVHIPFAPKAAAKGKIVHTNDLKVNLGAGIWVEMTALEAVQYLQRQRQRIIELHLRNAGDPGAVSPTATATQISLPSQNNKSPVEEVEERIRGQGLGSSVTPVVPTITVTDEQASQLDLAGSKTSSPSSLPKSSTPITQAIEQSSDAGQPLKDVDLVSLVQELAHQDVDADREGKGQVIEDESILNEDGLPFLEIRETSDQRDELVIEAASTAEASASTNVPDSQYWSEAAKKRRADLLRKVLGDDEDADETEEEDDEVGDEARAFTAGSELNSSLPSQSDNSSKPKSILKPPARKKSVSFEEDAASSKKNTTSLKTVEKPASSHFSVTQPTGSFAGFKRGFLSSPLKQEVKSSPAPQIVELPSTDPSTASISSTSSLPPKMESSQATSPAPKKKSLFALRKAQMTAPKTEAPVLPEKVIGKPAPVIGKSPRLPKASSSKPMTSMKYSVVERALEKPAAKPARRAKTDSDSDMSEYSDLDDDDMDIDQALLAREVALEYHKRRSMIPVHNDEGTLEGDEWDRETGQGRWSSDRQTRLGLPRLTDKDGQPIDVGMGDLVHASELNAHIRVGKLENGKLVVAAGDDSDDTEAEEDEVDEERRARREIKKQLLGGSISTPIPKPHLTASVTTAPVTAAPVADVQERSTTKASVTSTSTSVAEDVSNVSTGPPRPVDPTVPPKKVSRFKQARAAAQQ